MGDNIVNFYAGQPPLNRLSFHRNDTQRMMEHLNAAQARFVLFREGKPLLRIAGGEGKYDGLYFAEYKEVEGYVKDRSFATPPAEADVGSRTYQSARLPTTATTLVFLGIDDRPSSTGTPAKVDPKKPEGVPYFAVAVPSTEEGGNGVDALSGGEWVEPRLAGASLDPWQANIFAEARAMVDWNERNRYCAGCGSPAVSLWCGWKRACGSLVGEGRDGMGRDGKICPSTKGLHNYAYPRTDPVIIMGILNSTGDKMLLGRQKAWPKGMYSCLAGFCEPSESLEDAVRREVMEEAGVAVGQVRYSSSQPWPFPSNLMLGCYGLATSDSQDIHLDLDNELEDARWFSREEVMGMLESGANKIAKDEHKKFEPPAHQANSSAGSAAGVQEGAALAPAEGRVDVEDKPEGDKVRYRVPPRTAIAGMLVERWAKGELDEIKFPKGKQVSQL